jgi:hypothetical protein
MSCIWFRPWKNTIFCKFSPQWTIFIFIWVDVPLNGQTWCDVGFRSVLGLWALLNEFQSLVRLFFWWRLGACTWQPHSQQFKAFFVQITTPNPSGWGLFTWYIIHMHHKWSLYKETLHRFFWTSSLKHVQGLLRAKSQLHLIPINIPSLLELFSFGIRRHEKPSW